MQHHRNICHQRIQRLFRNQNQNNQVDGPVGFAASFKLD